MKNPEMITYPAAMTVAGSDSGGGAGIEADLRTFNAFGVFGTAVIAAITAQNPCEVSGVEGVSPEMVEKQLRTVFAKISVRALKTGMLFSGEIIRAAAKVLRERPLLVVADPVMVSTSGARLLCEDAVATLEKELLPLAEWITPNLPEAELLLGRRLVNEADFARGAAELSEKFGARVVLKTGHAEGKGNLAVDFVAMEDGVYELGSPRIALADKYVAHGTGCTFSAALAAGFALEMEPEEALRAAKGFVYGSLLEPVDLGGGLMAMYPPQESYEAKTFFRKKQ